MNWIARRLFLSALLVGTPSVWGQENVTTPGPQTAKRPAEEWEAWKVSVSPYGSHAFDADFGDSGESVAVSRVGVDTNTRVGLSAETSLTVGVLGEYSHYTFGMPGDDWDIDAVQVQVAPGVDHKLSEEWSVFGGAILQATGETSADVGNSMNYGGYAGARHKLSEKLSYTFGVAALTQLEDDVRVAPLFGFVWDINEGLQLGLGGSNNGGVLRVQQALSKTVAVAGVVGYEYRQYRLDEDGPVPDGVLQDSRVPVGVELAWKPNETFAARLTAGYVVWHEFEFNDEDGDELSNRHPDATPFVGVSANWQF